MAASFDGARRRGMRGILEAVTAAATLVEALAPLRADPARAAILLDVDGTLAPIVRHARRRARARGHARAADRDRQALRARRVRERPPRLRSRDGSSRSGSITYVGNHGAEVLRAGATEPEVDPEVATWTAASAGVHRRAERRESLHRLRVRVEDKDVITALPLARRARRGRRRGRRRASRRARRGGGLRHALGPQGARGAPAGAHRQGPRASWRCCATPTSTTRSTSATTHTDLDAFRGAAPSCVDEAGCDDRGLRSACAPTRRRASSRTRPTCWSTARPACARCSRRCSAVIAQQVRFFDFLKATVLISAGAATHCSRCHGGRRRRRRRPGSSSTRSAGGSLAR